MRLTSLELRAVPSRKLWRLASPIFPVLQTLTLNGWGLQLETQNITKIFPALHQLFLLGNSLEALCSQDISSFFLWQLPRLQYLRVQGDGRSPRPCYIPGLPTLQELKLQRLQSRVWPHSVWLQELVGELPRLQVLHLAQTGLETLSAAASQGLGGLQISVLDRETGTVLDGSPQEHSPQMPQYMYVLSSSLACQCANAWMGPWLKWSPRTYMHIAPCQLCQPEAGGHPKNPLFPFLWSHCPKTLGLELFLGSSALLRADLLALPARSQEFLDPPPALFRAWLQDPRGQKGE